MKFEDADALTQEAMMELAHWCSDFKKQGDGSLYATAIYNLAICGNEHGQLKIEPGQMPIPLDTIRHAIHGFIIANNKAGFLRVERDKGNPLGLGWLLQRKNISRYAESGLAEWEDWSKREQRRRDAKP